MVDEFLQVSEFPGVFAIGDCCKIDPELNKKQFPPTAQVAEAHAKTAAKNLRCLLSNTNMEKLIELIYKKNILKKNGIVILHRNKNTKEILPTFFKILDERVYGLSKIIFGNFLY